MSKYRSDPGSSPSIAVLTAAEYDREMAQDSAKDETQVWNLEKAYWEYVKANDLEKYRALWHDDFVGWPLFSAAPVRKDHVTRKCLAYDIHAGPRFIQITSQPKITKT